MRVEFHRLAEAELYQTARWLGRQGRAKRTRFIAAVRDTADRIAANPALGSPIFGHYRWVRAGRFKYIVYYRQWTADLVVIYAVAHAGRRPGYWLRRTTRP